MPRFLCWLFGHRTPPGVTRAFSICFECERCHVVVDGELAARRRAGR